MLTAVQLVRVVLGSALIVVGVIGFILPLIPGAPIVVWGFNLGFTWHPRGLRVWRRSKTWLLRLLRRLLISVGLRTSAGPRATTTSG